MSRVERKNYTILDVLSDIGGLSSVIASAIVLILSTTNGNHLDKHIIFQLFKFSDTNVKHTSVKQNDKKCRSVPFKLCCSKSHQANQLNRASDKLRSETDIVKLIRSIRYLKNAVNMLIPSGSKKELLQELSKMTDIDSIDKPNHDQVLQL